MKTLGAGTVSFMVPGLPKAFGVDAIRRRADDKKRPNILFIMSDDHSTNALGAYASLLSEVVRTPHLDRLAADGVRLDNCFCTNSICVPSRASILTGQYSHMNGVYSLHHSLDRDRQNVAKLLSAAGYETAVIGKWHLKSDPAGFDHWNILPGQGRYHDPEMKEKGKSERQIHEGFSTDVITDLSIEWLEERDLLEERGDRPFCLMTHYKNCHAPWHYAERHASLFEETKIPEPASLWEDKRHRSDGSREYGFTMETMAERMEKANYPTGPLDTDGLDGSERKRAAYQKFLKDYLRCVTAIDENVGRLLDFLDERGLAESTVVIYTSDQGYFLGEHDYIDKRWMFEESLRMPFIARYPGEIPARSTNDDIITNVDFAETLLDYAGLERPPSMQGRSFRANLSGRTPPDWPRSMYYHYWQHCNRPAHYGVRTQPAAHKTGVGALRSGKGSPRTQKRVQRSRLLGDGQTPQGGTPPAQKRSRRSRRETSRADEGEGKILESLKGRRVTQQTSKA